MKLTVRLLVACAAATVVWAGVSVAQAWLTKGSTSATTISGETNLAPPTSHEWKRSPSQVAALSDGVVTWDEYVTAFEAQISCVRSHGIPISDPVVRPGNALDATAGPFATYEEMERANALIRECDIEHLGGVLQQWAIQNSPSAAEYSAAREALADCLRDAGADVPAEVETVILAEYQQTHAADFQRCSDVVAEDYGLPGFAG